ncbi:MAG TPA: efflux RND transporter periplasmic adaptor subunit [Longimicrobiales bacterium]|nr:efflux RND transporter periplasmic adaptor subunit [Longimicrobiales bacterium]
MSRVGIGRMSGHGAFSLVALGTALALLGGCRSGEARPGEDDGGSDVAEVERITLDIRAEAAGLVEPIRVVEVKSKASGEILRLSVETGDDVQRGALLAEVDPRDVRNAYAQAEADLEVATSRLGTARSQRARVEELRKANVATEQELEAVTMEEANARAQLVKARTNLELAHERLGDVTIRAPIDGTVIQKTVEAGQIISSASGNVSGGTTLMLMADLEEMQVRTLVDETDIGRILPGQIARVTVEAYPTRTFLGTVYKIEPQAVVEQNVTMFPVLVRLDNRERLLRPGMNAEVQVEIARRDDVVAVPNAAVVSLRDMAAAAGALGLDPESMRGGMRGARDGAAERVAANGPGASTRPGAVSARPAADAEVTAADAEAPAAGAEAAAVSPERCAAIVAKAREQGREALTEEERSQAARCRRGGAGQQPASGDARRAMVFVRGAEGPEPRMVTLGLNDWDFTEVVSGLEPGERVYLISVARLQQQQDQMLERVRSRQNPFGGSTGGGRVR